MITIEELRVSKNGRSICHIEELSVAAGERVSITGANGTGKSTLLRVVAGLEREFDGRCSLSIPRTHCTYVHPSPYLFRGSILDNATYGLRARGMPRRDAHRQAWDLLQRLGIERLDQACDGLSGGERRRVAFARAILFKPCLLLLDEPFADLDENGIRLVAAELAKTDSTLLFASPQRLPIPIATRTVAIGKNEENQPFRSS